MATWHRGGEGRERGERPSCLEAEGWAGTGQPLIWRSLQSPWEAGSTSRYSCATCEEREDQKRPVTCSGSYSKSLWNQIQTSS